MGKDSNPILDKTLVVERCIYILLISLFCGTQIHIYFCWIGCGVMELMEYIVWESEKKYCENALCCCRRMQGLVYFTF